MWEWAGTLRTLLMSLPLIFSPTTGLLSLSVQSVRSLPSWSLPPSAPRKFPFPKSALAPPALRFCLGHLVGGQDHNSTQQNPTHPTQPSPAQPTTSSRLECCRGKQPPGPAVPLTLWLFLPFPAAGTGGCELVHPNTGSGGHHWEEGAAHQAAGTVCWCLHQGEWE